MAQCFLYYSLNQLSLGWIDSLQMFYAGPRGIPSTEWDTVSVSLEWSIEHSPKQVCEYWNQ